MGKNCVKIVPPSTAEFSGCRAVFVDFKTANRLKRAGMATVISGRPFVLRLRPRAVSSLHFVPWSKISSSFVTSGSAINIQGVREKQR